jgi:serine phosphatase RsbU (regulator of sigma subunit)
MARILVVEDEPGIALGLEDSLRLDGHQVDMIGDGLTAAALARRQEFDLILLDVMLPGKNGFEICAELRRLGNKTPIVMLTARGLEQDRILGLDLGANDYVTKPFSPGELMARVRGLLRANHDASRERRLHEEEVRSAFLVQQNLFPRDHPVAEGLDYACACRPALGVSGDYYDIIPLDSGKLGLLVADVCGKGMPAALLGASLHAAIRAIAPGLGSKCGEVLSTANRLLYEATSAEKYATAFYAIYDPGNFTLTYSNAGHYPPIIAAEKSCSRLDSLTPPVGLVPELQPLQRMVKLSRGTRLLIASDGIGEAWNDSGESFGDERLEDMVAGWGHRNARTFCNEVLDAVTAFAGQAGQADDMTLIAARVN